MRITDMRIGIAASDPTRSQRPLKSSLLPFQKRRHAFPVISGQSCERKLIDVLVSLSSARVRQLLESLVIAAEIGGWLANLAASAIAVSKAMPGSATSSLRRPCVD
jgi:hypothetical protein